MKRCPQCNRVETDDSLVFCRTDGAALINDSLPFPGEAGTAQFGSAPTEIETSILPHSAVLKCNRVELDEALKFEIHGDIEETRSAAIGSLCNMEEK